MKAAGFAFSSHDQSHIGVNEYMTKSIEDLSLNQVYERIDEIARCLNGNGKDCRNDKLRELSNELIKITENIPNFLVKAGSVLTVKTTDEEGHIHLHTRSLPISAQIHIDKKCRPVKGTCQADAGDQPFLTCMNNTGKNP